MIQINFPNNYVQCVFDCGVQGCSAYTNAQKKYTFKVPKNLVSEIKIGDRVVVDTSNGFQVVTVVGTSVSAYQATKYVVDIVHMDAYEKAINDEKRAKMLREQLEQKKAKFEKEKMYEMLAASDPEVAKLLEALKELED